MVTQDQILDTFNKISGVFFLVMITLSSVALLVGGIGVMAVMMISVTDRTRESGIRKAVGATRRDILQQFLIEAAALTGAGGVIGVVIGLVLGRFASSFMNVHAATPVNITLIAVAVSVGIGLVFGVLPARRAAQLDPIESLRYEELLAGVTSSHGAHENKAPCTSSIRRQQFTTLEYDSRSSAR